jgi:hypothetical protein
LQPHGRPDPGHHAGPGSRPDPGADRGRAGAAERFRAAAPLLRARGLRVSIDDFGTGYSSLSMLSDEIADEVKIDRTFISQVHQRPRSRASCGPSNRCAGRWASRWWPRAWRPPEELDSWAPAHGHPLRPGLLVRPPWRWRCC